jgi:hypothetical protein
VGLLLASAPRLVADEEPPGPATPARSEAPGSSEEPSTEPATRVGEWLRLRQERSERLEPYAPGFVERSILAFEKAERPSLAHWNLWGFYPRIQGIASGSANAIGLRFWQPDIGGTSIDAHASAFYSWHHYEFYDAQLGRIPHPEVRAEAAGALPMRSTKGDDLWELGGIQRPGDPAWSAYLSARYQHYTRYGYFGIGPDSLREEQTSFLNQDALFEVRGSYQPGRHALVALRAGYLRTWIGSGEDPELPSIEEVFDEETAPGLTAPPDLWKLTSFLLFDTRDFPANPNHGVMIGFELSRYIDPDGGFSFNRFGFDARAFAPLGSPQRVLALRAHANADDPDPGARVPFFLQSFLGGSHTLRGFRNFRYRGESSFLLSAEYRWEAIPAIELALFVDSGTVGGEAADIDLGKLRTSFGAALRLKLDSAILCRLEWAKGPEDQRFYLRFSPAW